MKQSLFTIILITIITFSFSYVENALLKTAAANRNIHKTENTNISKKTTPKVEKKQTSKKTKKSTKKGDLQKKTTKNTNKKSKTKKKTREKTTKISKNGDLSDKIFLTEIFPNPPGPDTKEEWIELFNEGDTKISLGNWTLDDAEDGSKPYTFPSTTTIKSQEYLVIPKNISKISLNNNKDIVKLSDFKKNIVDEIEYEESKENTSFAKIHIEESDEIWEWTSDITKGKENPRYEMLTGKIEQFQENPVNPEQNELLLRTDIEQVEVFISNVIIESSLAKTLFVPQTEIKIIAKKRNEKNYDLKSFEILKKAPPEKQKTNTSITFIKWTILVLIAGICLKRKNTILEKIKTAVISKK